MILIRIVNSLFLICHLTVIGFLLKFSHRFVGTPEKDYILNTNDLTTRDFSLTFWSAPYLGVRFSKDSKYVIYFWGSDSDSTLRIKRIIDNQFVFYYDKNQFTKYGLTCYDISNDNQYFLSLINNKPC